MTSFRTASADSVVPGRSCGTCTMCCKVFDLPVVQSPVGKWCRHCAPGKGCRIYESRPDICKDFFCGWLLSPELGPEWKPDRSKVVLQVNVDTNGSIRLTANVDDSYPTAWQRPDIYGKLKQWAIAGAATASSEMKMLVRVVIGRRYIIILPDRDVDVGMVADDEAVMTSEKVTPQGVVVEVRKVKRASASAGDSVSASG